MDLKEWAKIQESLLKSQLKIIRQFLKDEEQPTFRTRGKGMSQMSIIYDVLLAAQTPLHVTEIIARAKKDFNVHLDRDSIVSAITKKVKNNKMFKRVKANTFTLLSNDKEPAP